MKIERRIAPNQEKNIKTCYLKEEGKYNERHSAGQVNHNNIP
jgi:hypothetical protein